MKKLTLSSLVAMFVFALAACGNDDKDKEGLSKACPTAPAAMATAPTLPGNFPDAQGITYTGVKKDGPSTVASGYLPDTIGPAHDAYVTAVTNAPGYKVTHEEQDSGLRGELHRSRQQRAGQDAPDVQGPHPGHDHHSPRLRIALAAGAAGLALAAPAAARAPWRCHRRSPALALAPARGRNLVDRSGCGTGSTRPSGCTSRSCRAVRPSRSPPTRRSLVDRQGRLLPDVGAPLLGVEALPGSD